MSTLVHGLAAVDAIHHLTRKHSVVRSPNIHFKYLRSRPKIKRVGNVKCPRDGVVILWLDIFWSLIALHGTQTLCSETSNVLSAVTASLSQHTTPTIGVWPPSGTRPRTKASPPNKRPSTLEMGCQKPSRHASSTQDQNTELCCSTPSSRTGSPIPSLPTWSRACSACPSPMSRMV